MADALLALAAPPTGNGATAAPQPAPVPDADLGDLVQSAAARAEEAVRALRTTRHAHQGRGRGKRRPIPLWVIRTRLRLARQGCTLRVETTGSRASMVSR